MSIKKNHGDSQANPAQQGTKSLWGRILTYKGVPGKEQR